MNRSRRIYRGGGAMVATRVSPAEREALNRLAAASDRTPSREVRRAIRYYLAFYEQADAYLRGELKDEP